MFNFLLQKRTRYDVKIKTNILILIFLFLLIYTCKDMKLMKPRRHLFSIEKYDCGLMGYIFKMDRCVYCGNRLITSRKKTH